MNERTTELVERTKADEIKFVSLQFTDVTGTIKNVTIPVTELAEALDNGIWFDGSTVEGFTRIAESDMYLMPDVNTYQVLPWSPPEQRTARLICDVLQLDGQPFSGDPRFVLKSTLSECRQMGYTYHVSSELEFFLFSMRDDKPSTAPVPHDVASYFDFSPRDLASDVRQDIILALEAMGIKVERAHHEVASGQHEINFRYADALTSADNCMTFKYVVKAVAQEHGLHATFMPKPLFGLNGSGMHTHQSFFDSKGKNAFFDPEDRYRLSALAYHFMAGQMKHARALTANLAYAAMLAAGMEGIKHKLNPPPPVEENVYDFSDEKLRELSIDTLPGSLIEALGELERDEVLRETLGEHVYEAFMRAKNAEWDQYRTQVTQWELDQYLTFL